MAVNGIEIEVGQKWRMANGGLTLIINENDDDQYMFVTAHGTVTENGTTWVGDKPHEYDLVELVDNGVAESLAVEMLTDLGWSFDGQCWIQDKPDGYEKLSDVLHRALLQASQGKGKERHASGDTPFEEQPMATINRQLGSVHGFIYQAHKKSLEAMRLPAGRDVAELLGSINYLCGAVIALESWARKD
jgi:hypothetical protein